MPHAQPEYAITAAIAATLLSIDIPCIERGKTVVGAVCIAAALGVAAWTILVILRSRK